MVAKSCLAYTSYVAKKNIPVKYQFAGRILFIGNRHNNRKRRGGMCNWRNKSIDTLNNFKVFFNRISYSSLFEVDLFKNSKVMERNGVQ